MLAFLNHWEIIAVLVVALLLFGNRLPTIARSLGSSISGFKQGLKDADAKDESTPTKGNGSH
jgi:TatA/E family protein of Tat protein translocase